jgi:hypothetical protein
VRSTEGGFRRCNEAALAIFIGKTNERSEQGFDIAPAALGLLPIVQRIAPHGLRFPDSAALHPGCVAGAVFGELENFSGVGRGP